MIMKLRQHTQTKWSLILILFASIGLIVIPTTTVKLPVFATPTSAKSTNSTQGTSNNTMQNGPNATGQVAKDNETVKSTVSNATKIGETTPKDGKQSNKSSEQAAQSIRGAIVSTGQFLKNVMNKVAGSKSAQTLLNETSEALGNASTAAQKMFSGTR